MPDRRERADVVIVGAGASGSLLAGHLLRSGSARGPLVLVERRGSWGPGEAYSTSASVHLLNVPAGGMSAVHDQPNHLVDWLRDAGVSAGPEDFLPRSTYGRYLRSVLDSSEVASDRKLLRIRGNAVDVRPAPGGVVVDIEGSEPVWARRAVLALGNAPPRTPSCIRPAAGSPYVADPWDGLAMDRIRAGDPVLLLGTGLTAVDVALSLKARGHGAPIYAASRHGLLPTVHRSPADGTHTLRALGALPSPLTTAHLIRWVREEMRAARKEGVDWRDVINSLRPWAQKLWMDLPLMERRIFLKHAARTWSVLRHRMAPRIGKEVDRMRGSGQLTVMAGDARVVERGRGFDVEISSPGNAPRPIRASWIVNCTGPELDPGRSSEPLLRSSLGRGTVRRDALGLGLDCTPEGAVLDSSGNASGILWAIGPLRVGSLWESTAIPEIRQQAAQLSDDLESGIAQEVGLGAGALKMR